MRSIVFANQKNSPGMHFKSPADAIATKSMSHKHRPTALFRSGIHILLDGQMSGSPRAQVKSKTRAAKAVSKVKIDTY